MRNLSTTGVAVLAGVLALTGAGCDKLKSRDHINKGALAFRNAKYADAVEEFKKAGALDPTNPNARLYLGASYMVQWIPGAESPENMEYAAKAREQFNQVIEKDAGDKAALTTAYSSLGSMAYNQAQSLPQDQKLAKFDEAAKWNSELIKVDPQNKDAYYFLGVIAYQKFHPADMLARVNAHMKPEEPGPFKEKKVRDELRTQYTAILDEGIANLNKALEIDKEYEDAMAYLNLLIREKADLLDEKDEYPKQIEVADNWLQKALDTRKAKTARAAAKGAGGIVSDSQ
jgi:tetratricopeptide (TPR) repeat protein